MKSLIVVALILFVVSPLRAGTLLVTGLPISSASCTTAVDSCSGDNGDLQVGNATAQTYISSAFVADANISDPGICTIELLMREIGTYAGNLQVGVWSDDGGTPGAPTNGGMLGNLSTNTVGAAELPATDGTVEFTGITTGALTLGVTYHVVVVSSTVDAANHAIWNSHSFNCPDEEEIGSSSDDTDWGNVVEDRSGNFQAFSQ